MSDDKQRPQSVSPRDALWACVGLASLLIVGAIILIILGKDVQQMVNVAMLVAIPLLTGLGFVLYGKMESVNTNVNGRLTELINHAINSRPLPKEDE